MSIYDDLKSGEIEMQSPMSRLDPKVPLVLTPKGTSDKGVVTARVSLFGATLGDLSVSSDGATHFQEIK